MKIQIIDKRLLEYELKPSTPGAAGLDLRACIESPIVLTPQQTLLINTGIKTAIPENWVGIAVPRSKLGSLGLVLGNTAGIIDSDYRGIIKLVLYNRNKDFGFYKNTNIHIHPMDRVAQLLIIPHYNFNCLEIETKELPKSLRGEGGFGSTGI